MEKIVFVVGSLRMGGTERVVSLISAGLAKRGYDVCVISLSNTKSDHYPLSSDVQRVALDVERAANNYLVSGWAVMRRISILRRAILTQKPDVVLSFTDRLNIMALVALIGKNIPVVVNVRTPHAANGATIRSLSKLLYRRADMLLSNGQHLDHEWAWLPHARRAVIFNPLSHVDVDVAPEHVLPENRHHIIHMGRLIPTKNQRHLLTAFAKLAEDFSDWDLIIIGDGPLHDELSAYAATLGLADRIVFTGRLQTPFATIKQGDIFALTSLFEGQPNALLEAMACGLPVVSTDYVGDPRAIVEHGVNGLIVANNDIAALCDALASLMRDPERRLKFGSAARQVRERFALNTILDQWERIISEISSVPE